MKINGFSLVEVLLALALTAIVITGVASGLLYTDRLVMQLTGRATARLQASECISVARWLRDANGFDALSSGVYGLASPSGQWQLVSEPPDGGTFTRRLHIDDEDAFTKRIECIVEWTEQGLPASRSVVSRLAQ